MLKQFFSFWPLIFPTECIACGKTGSLPVCAKCFPEFKIANKKHRCNVCFNEMLTKSAAVCAICSHSPPKFSKLRFIWKYDQSSRIPIAYMKYHPSERILEQLAAGMAGLYGDLFEGLQFDLLIPIPASAASLQQRKFHVTHYLARAIKRRNSIKAEIPLTALDYRDKDRTPQASLTRKQRLVNANNCFYACRRQVQGRRILLVEDVISTGATINSAVGELFKNDAKSVSIYCLANNVR